MSEKKKTHSILGKKCYLIMDAKTNKQQQRQRHREKAGEYTGGLELVPMLQSRAMQPWGDTSTVR